MDSDQSPNDAIEDEMNVDESQEESEQADGVEESDSESPPSRNARERYMFADSPILQRIRVLLNLTRSQANNPPSADSEQAVENSVNFDRDLPAQHLYLGENMSRVSGVEYLEAGKHHRIMLFLHQHLIYPGDILPLMIPNFIIDSAIDPTSGFLFGVAFPRLRSKEDPKIIYGVTCQIYEKGTNELGNTLVKSRALQRFITLPDTATEQLEYINASPNLRRYGHIKILPEIYLPEPLRAIDMGSMNRFRGISAYEKYFTNYQTATASWPAHIYKYYNINSIIEKAQRFLELQKVDAMPQDPVALSFWLARNLHLPKEQLKTIFITDSVNIRFKIISEAFKDERKFICGYCSNYIAKCSDLFAMSKHGVQSQYCNSAGYIHETNTVYQIIPESVSYSGNPSTEFSWFPGYSWQIIVCKNCNRHLGWKFQAIEPNLTPPDFYGISRASVRISKNLTTPIELNYDLYLNILRAWNR